MWLLKRSGWWELPDDDGGGKSICVFIIMFCVIFWTEHSLGENVRLI